ncbi:ABC transporter substrate-binding protein [Marivirga sp. S37H4]|uniref:ABC transporter substrate-binding protein n=1 Tax=Marivirga aurantiaca TaxID=2802615 RepID=A0A935C5G3_9BACT|nr:ABC transporter substrate-binding protein [Marivirga aurantiaca]MBK6263799.1 ABC transporter substrate-binding protein [Marivirga aurantiaca]
MSKSVKCCLLIISSLIAFQSLGQVNYQSEYLSGKNYFREGNYQMAKNKFVKVLDSDEQNPFYLYASYFYGISAYQTGNEKEGMEQFRKVRITHPQWDKLDELNVWYGHMLLDQADLFKGLEVLNGIKKTDLKEIASVIKKKHLNRYDSIPLLQKAIELNPYDSVLAKHLAEVISKKPLVDRPIELLEFLIESFDLEKAEYDFFDKNVSQKKKTYNVAVMLPFMADNLTTTMGNKANQFVLDLYQGIQQAADELNEDGQKIKLFAYDTKRDSVATAKILASGELLEMDMVIGPLYPAPFKLMTDYSNKNRINMVNPLSTSSSIIGTNPYSFLLKSTTETRAKKAADYVKENFPNKRATIFYGESSQDSIFAHSYRKYLEADSFKITWFAQAVTPEESTEILKELTTVYEENSSGELTTKRSVKVRVDKDDELYLSKDSIGHIMVASSDNLLISNVLSAVDTRRDGLPVLGFEDWLDINQISFEQLERMGVIMIGQNYFDFSSQKVANFKQKYKNTYNTLPSQFSYDGYETMMVFGRNLIKYGNYFQYGIYEKGYTNGFLYHGFDYSNANDNQFVPIMKLENLDLKMLDKEDGNK